MKWPTSSSRKGRPAFAENAKLATYVFVDIRGRDLGGYVADAKTAVNENVELPAGTYLIWSDQ